MDFIYFIYLLTYLIMFNLVADKNAELKIVKHSNLNVCFVRINRPCYDILYFRRKLNV